MKYGIFGVGFGGKDYWKEGYFNHHYTPLCREGNWPLTANVSSPASPIVRQSSAVFEVGLSPTNTAVDLIHWPDEGKQQLEGTPAVRCTS